MTNYNHEEALLNLIDDPDEEIFDTVKNRIVSLGTDMIPVLEDKWEKETSEDTQERIEIILHDLYFSITQEKFKVWKQQESPSLLEGALLVECMENPKLDSKKLIGQIEKIRRNIWLELNPYLTPIEQINVMNSIYFNYYKHVGLELSYDDPEIFLLNYLLETQTGNYINNAILYLILCEMLDIPVTLVKITNMGILSYSYFLAYTYPDAINNKEGADPDQIKFFIDPMTGKLCSQKEIKKIFRETDTPDGKNRIDFLSNIDIIRLLLMEISSCYNKASNTKKCDEISALTIILYN